MLSNNHSHLGFFGLVMAVLATPLITLAHPKPVEQVSTANTSETTIIPTAKELFPETSLPYDGLGSVWIGPDGWVRIKTEVKGGGLTFFMNVDGRAINEEDGKVSIRRDDPRTEAIHRFQPLSQDERADQLSIIYDIPGYLTMDYDEAKGRLHVRVDGAKQIFETIFKFDHSKPIPEASSHRDETAQNSCECTSDACTAQKTCDVGYSCRCTCQTGQNASCTCSDCEKNPRHSEVDPVPVPEPPAP